MLSSGILGWLISSPQHMALLAQHWLYGLLVVAGLVFLETALVVLPFLPGDSLLFAAGTFLSLNGKSVLTSFLVVSLAAVLGDSINYLLGRSQLGQVLIRRGWIKPRHLDMTRRYFARFGGVTIFLGRFVPVVRSVAPFLAGLSGMCARRFALYNVAGALAWCASLLFGGFWLGDIAWVRSHLMWIPVLIVVASLLPLCIHAARHFARRGG